MWATGVDAVALTRDAHRRLMTRALVVALGLVTVAIGVAIRLILVQLKLVNGSVEFYMPLTYVVIGIALLWVKDRRAVALLTVAAILGLVLVGMLVAIGGAAPYAR